MSLITAFHPGTTKVFSITIMINGVAQDISGDTVNIFFKAAKSDDDAAAEITKAADVASAGASGIAAFTLEPADTDVDPGTKYVDIRWVTAGSAERVVYDDTVVIKTRVSDSPSERA